MHIKENRFLSLPHGVYASDESAHWRLLADTNERSLRGGGDATLC